MSVKVCSSCGEEKSLGDFSPRSGAPDGRKGRCRQCINEANKSAYADNPEGFVKRKTRWKSANGTRWSAGNAWFAAKVRAEKRGIPFSLTKEDIDDLVRSSDGKCALSGLPFAPSPTPGRKWAFSPSLDRVEPLLGYTKDNVRLILDGLNSLKLDGTDEDMLAICRAVVERNS